jgi:hypothetical protein
MSFVEDASNSEVFVDVSNSEVNLVTFCFPMRATMIASTIITAIRMTDRSNRPAFCGCCLSGGRCGRCLFAGD